MDNFFFSINVVLPLFVLMAVGYVAKQLNFVSGTFLSEANRFVFRFSLPLMLFQNIRSTFHGEFPDTKIITVSLITMLAVILLSFCIVPPFIKKQGQRGSIIQSIYRSNFLIYGIPLATGMYGKEAMAQVSMLMGVMIPFFNVAAVIILSIYSETHNSRLTVKNIFNDIIKNPLIIGCAFGLLFGSLQIQLPSFIDKPMGEFAAIATPLALFVMGGEFKFKSFRVNLWKVFAATTSRLVIVPTLAISIFIYLGFRGADLGALLCLFATPTAVSSYIMAENMGCDGELSAQIVVLTTICSCITIFLFVFGLKSLGFL